MAQNGLVPVTVARHSHQYWKRFTSYNFAANRDDCSIVLQEVPQIAASFPIVFKETSRGIEPRAVFSTSVDLPNPFVSPDGQWLAAYVPSELRCQPFRAKPVGLESAGRPALFQLNVDEASGLLSTNPKDEPFFDRTGEMSPALRDVRSFLQTRTAAHNATLALCQTIKGLKLFEPVETHDGIALPAGTFCISTPRLAKLPRIEKLKLIDSGAFLLIHAHQVSLSHIAWLARVQCQMARSISPNKYTENLDISGFLHAMANAQNDDFLGTSEV
ncbi:SapC family protein [Ruegeria arenilitoris]|uniref:SapC family protein n=1 Tax=Ruegeria arenilitoris TaxID=1173585 RepID=UPI00147EC8E0|nr:SapC family protein [Ruegeria arenilitoris]